VTSLAGYNRASAIGDLAAGLTVGLVALPLAMAFAIASGLPPQAGLYCAVFTGFIVSVLGGSRTQIAGPTGAFVVVVAGIVSKHGVDGLFICTMMAGVLLVIMGVTGMGAAVRFIPRPVVVGFTNGIAVLIASTQVATLRPHRCRPKRVLARSSRWQDAHDFIRGDRCRWLRSSSSSSRTDHAAHTRFDPRSAMTTVVRAGIPIDTVGSRFGGIRGPATLRDPPFRPSLIPGSLRRP
jgi:SulP family sulfate permease